MPFTIEEDFYQTTIVVMDDSGDDLDICMIIENTGEYEGYVSIRQYEPNTECFEVITMSPNMFKDLIKSWTSPEGFHGLQWE